MKKLLIILCAAAVLSAGMLTGCGSRGGVDSPDTPDSAEGTDSVDSTGDPSSEAGSDSAGTTAGTLIQFEKPGDDALIATIKTSMGEFKAVLYPQYAPKAVENFYTHATKGYYNGLTFHIAVSGMMIQTGDPKGDGTGGESIWDKPFEDEFTDDLWNFRGALSMAHPEGKDKNGSQFYVVQAPAVPATTLEEMEKHKDIFVQDVADKYKEVGGMPWRDHKDTVFGQIISGIETVDKISDVEVDENFKPKDKVIIESISFNKKLDTASSAPASGTDEKSK